MGGWVGLPGGDDSGVIDVQDDFLSHEEGSHAHTLEDNDDIPIDKVTLAAAVREGSSVGLDHLCVWVGGWVDDWNGCS